LALQFPKFDLTQKIRLTIEEETLSNVPHKAILTREFLTQTGFKIKTQANRKYRLRIESAGA